MNWRRARNDESQGYDSFLDIVANLVGILVILIMVIGVRARNAWEQAEQQDADEAPAVVAAGPPAQSPFDTTLAEEKPAQADPQELETDATELITQKQTELNEVQRQVSGLEASAVELATELANLETVGYQRAEERDQLQILVAAARQELDEKQRQLSEQQQQQLALQKNVRDSEQLLSRIETELSATRATIGTAQTLEHHPTPLAQTVFGREEHFRLQHGRLCYVPINEIVDVLQNDARNKIWKLKDISEVTETIGPFDGFHVRYRLRRVERRVPAPEGTVMRTTIEVARFTLIPTHPHLGEPLAHALSPGSAFSQRMQRLSPQGTTVTVWTYPESFADFRALKSFLLERGFLAAARPLPDGFPISGSPEGSRSAAE